MARNGKENRITLSVLDRLLDDEPHHKHEAPASRSWGLDQLKVSVRDHLDWLLNTRQVVGGVPPDLEEVSRSLAAYGLPDFSTLNVKDPKDQNRVRRELETAISIFEPRLIDVTVTLVPTDKVEQRLLFRIDARLRVEPAPEPVTFDTEMELGNCRFSFAKEY